MTQYEYKVVPAPKRGERVRGIKAGEDRFAIALTNIMNAQAAAGWEYQRTETLPSEEREGLMGKTTVFQNMMVFRRLHIPACMPATPPTPLIEDRRDAPVVKLHTSGDAKAAPPAANTDDAAPAPEASLPKQSADAGGEQPKA